MLHALANGIASGVLSEGPIKNAALEAFLLHARALIEFFYKISPRPDDITAQDFMSTESNWADICPSIPPALAEARHRAGKHLAHLTFERLSVTPDTKPWPLLDILSGIVVPMRVFMQHVPEGVLSDEWPRDGQV